MNQQPVDVSVRWTWGRTAAVFATLFWLIPAVVAVSAAGFSGDCESFLSGDECTRTERIASDTSGLLALFMAAISAPLTVLVILLWSVRSLLHSPSAGEAAESTTGIRVSYIYGCAVVLWWFIVVGVVAAIVDREGAWLMMAIIPGIVGVPLALILLVDSYMRRRSRKIQVDRHPPQRRLLSAWPDAAFLFGTPIGLAIIVVLALVIFANVPSDDDEPRVVTVSVGSLPDGLPFRGRIGVTGEQIPVVGTSPASYEIPRVRKKGVTVVIEGDSDGEGALIIDVDCGGGYWREQWIGESGKFEMECPAFD